MYYTVMMGGRGAASGIGKSSKTGGPMKVYDETQRYKGYSIHQWENATRDKKVEHVALFNKDGNLIFAGTSHNKNSVAIPTGMINMSDVDTLTHNHPYNANRPIGGTFSEADVINSTLYGIRQTRAVSNGVKENTYILRATSGANTAGMHDEAHKIQSNNTMQNTGEKAYKKVKNRLAKQGKQISLSMANQVAIGSMKQVWKDSASKYGYEYIEVKEKHW